MAAECITLSDDDDDGDAVEVTNANRRWDAVWWSLMDTHAV